MFTFFPSVLIGLVAIAFFSLRKVGQRPKGCPPGPPTLPIIGNLHQMPKSHPHVQFKKWAEEYGPIYSLVIGTSVTIVLSSDVAIKDLLDKRSGIYSSRPEMYISRLASGDLRMVLMVRVRWVILPVTTWRQLTQGRNTETSGVASANCSIPSYTSKRLTRMCRTKTSRARR